MLTALRCTGGLACWQPHQNNKKTLKKITFFTVQHQTKDQRIKVLYFCHFFLLLCYDANVSPKTFVQDEKIICPPLMLKTC